MEIKSDNLFGTSPSPHKTSKAFISVPSFPTTCNHHCSCGTRKQLRSTCHHDCLSKNIENTTSLCIAKPLTPESSDNTSCFRTVLSYQLCHTFPATTLMDDKPTYLSQTLWDETSSKQPDHNFDNSQLPSMSSTIPVSFMAIPQKKKLWHLAEL